jgi:hypothetical protein
MKNSNDAIGNRTCDLPVYSAVPQPTALPRTRNIYEYQEYFLGGNGVRCVGLTNLSPSSANCLEIWETQPPGNLWAFPGLLQGLL